MQSSLFFFQTISQLLPLFSHLKSLFLPAYPQTLLPHKGQVLSLNTSDTLLLRPLVLLVHPVTTGLLLPCSKLWSLYSICISAVSSEWVTLLSIIRPLWLFFSPLFHIYAHAIQCPFRLFSIIIIPFLLIFISLLICASPNLKYSSSVVTTNLEDLSVLRMMMSGFVFGDFSGLPFLWLRDLTSALLFLFQFSSLNFLYVAVCVFLLALIIASSLDGLGRVTLQHSFRSVTLRFLSSKILSTGSKILLAHLV